MGDNDFGICPDMLNSVSNEIKDVNLDSNSDINNESHHRDNFLRLKKLKPGYLIDSIITK